VVEDLGPMRLAIISDTHLPRGGRVLPGACLERLRSADAILHAGDLAELSVLAELEALGPPVHAVRGNVDSAELQARLPLTRIVEVEGARIAMIHDSGPAQGRLERLRRRFPDAHAVVFGHSHVPLHEERDGFAIFNPGSPTERRRAQHHTMGLATIQDGRPAFELLALD
jgi:putative phosphoesterase